MEVGLEYHTSANNFQWNEGHGCHILPTNVGHRKRTYVPSHVNLIGSCFYNRG